MLETSGRLLRLLSLLQTRREWAGGDLADRLEVTTRTVRRDVDKLRELGYPVEATRGTAGGYRLGAGAELPPLLLDDEEAIAVAVGLRTAAAGVGVAGIEETSVRALAKLEQVLPNHLRRRVSALGTFTESLPGIGPAVDAAVLAAISAACRDHERLRFGYRRHDGGEARRTVEPLRLVRAENRWYLVAFDVERDDWRTFRVDRIAGIPSPDRRFHPRPAPAEDLAAYVSRNVTAARGHHQARVLLHAPYELLVERVPQLLAALEKVDDETTLLTAGADWLGGIAVHIATTGVDFEVLDPPELLGEVQRLAAAFGRAAERSPVSAARERADAPGARGRPKRSRRGGGAGGSSDA